MLGCSDDQVRIKLRDADALCLLEELHSRGVSQDWPFHALGDTSDQVLDVIAAGFGAPYRGFLRG
jgi:hypothetical protein